MPPIVIRYDRARVFRSALIFWGLGLVAGWAVAWGASSGRLPLARLISIAGLPPGPIAFCLVSLPATLAAVYTVVHALRRENTVTLTPSGLEIRDSVGAYAVAWDNVAGCELYLESIAGLRLHDRSALLNSHQGSPTQRDLLASRDPVGGYDLTFGTHEIDCAPGALVALIDRFRSNSEARDQLAG